MAPQNNDQDVKHNVSSSNHKSINSNGDATTFEKVKSVIIDQLGINGDSIKMESHFVDDFGADSLDQVELVMHLEEHFGIEIPDNVAETMLTVADAVRYIDANK